MKLFATSSVVSAASHPSCEFTIGFICDLKETWRRKILRSYYLQLLVYLSHLFYVERKKSEVKGRLCVALCHCFVMML